MNSFEKFDEIEILNCIDENPLNLLNVLSSFDLTTFDETNKNKLYGLFASFIMGKFDESHMKLFLMQLYNNTYVNINNKYDDFVNNVIQYIGDNMVDDINTYLCNLLNNIAKTKISDEDYIYNAPKMLWKYDVFRNNIKFEHYDLGVDYMKNNIFIPYYLNNYNDNYDKIINSFKYLINDVDIHEQLIDYFHEILIRNMPYIQSNPTIEKMKKCCPFYFLSMIQKTIFEICDIHFVCDDFEKRLGVMLDEIQVKDYKINDLQFLDKLLITSLLSVKIVTISSIKSYHNISIELKKYNNSKLTEQQNSILKSILPHSEIINKLYITYSKLNLDSDDILLDLVNYVDYATIYLSKQIYKLDDKLFGIISNIVGGQSKNIHTRFYALQILFKLSSEKGLLVFTNIFNNIFKFINEVDFFKWTLFQGVINTQLKIIQTLLMLSDLHIEEIIKSRNVVVGTLFKLIEKSILLLSDFDNICKVAKTKNKISKDVDIGLCYIIEIISLTLVFHSEIYKKKLISTIYPEVEEKYGILINEILKSTTNGKHSIYSIFRRPDLAGTLTHSTYISINNHIEFNSNCFELSKKLIIDNIDYSRLSKDEKDNIINKLNKIIENKKDIPEELLDPFTCKLITDPVKIPDVDHIFDRTSILMQIQHNNINPYTRKPLTYELLIEHNNKPEIIEEIKEFQDKINDFLKND